MRGRTQMNRIRSHNPNHKKTYLLSIPMIQKCKNLEVHRNRRLHTWRRYQMNQRKRRPGWRDSLRLISRCIHLLSLQHSRHQVKLLHLSHTPEMDSPTLQFKTRLCLLSTLLRQMRGMAPLGAGIFQRFQHLRLNQYTLPCPQHLQIRAWI